MDVLLYACEFVCVLAMGIGCQRLARELQTLTVEFWRDAAIHIQNKTTIKQTEIRNTHRT